MHGCVAHAFFVQFAQVQLNEGVGLVAGLLPLFGNRLAQKLPQRPVCVQQWPVARSRRCDIAYRRNQIQDAASHVDHLKALMYQMAEPQQALVVIFKAVRKFRCFPLDACPFML